MPIVNIVDHRSNKYCIEIDAVFEPAWHDNSIVHKHKNTTQFIRPEKDDFMVEQLYDTTVLKAIKYANRKWKQETTVFMYDKGSHPLSRSSKR